MKQKLATGREDAYFAQKLARIVTNVPCDIDWSAAEFQGLNFKGFETFLERMEIKSLVGRVKKITPESKRVS